MFRITVDKIASATKNVPLKREVWLDEQMTAEEGYIVAGKVIGEKSTYNTIENGQGRMISLHDGDIIVGVLGHRNALHGYSGVVPDKIAIGDTLQLLNLGGVIGKCTSVNPEIGKPFNLEILGQVLVFPEFGSRVGTAAHVKMNSLTTETPLSQAKKVPVVYVAGTCMNAGKTLASCQIVRYLSSQGVKVAACKLTGVSLLRDVLNMRDYGADYAASFIDCGIVTTSKETAAPSAQTVLSHLSQTDADVIIAELGDGLLGEYGVGNILEDSELKNRASVFILCANDPVGAWGGVELLKDRYGIKTDIISGPTTDNDVGIKFIEEHLKIKAINARIKGTDFAKHVHKILKRLN